MQACLGSFLVSFVPSVSFPHFSIKEIQSGDSSLETDP